MKKSNKTNNLGKKTPSNEKWGEEPRKPPRNFAPAPLLLILHVTYHDKFGNVLRVAKINAARLFSREEGYRLYAQIKRTKTDKHVGFENNTPQYIERLTKAPKMCYIGLKGEESYESVESFTIVNKTDWFNRGM